MATPGESTGRGPDSPEQLGTVRSLVHAMSSWRTASVVLLSFSSGMPLALVWIAIPDWMRKAGVDIRVVGLFTLAQAPWAFNVVWAPLMDRYRPPFLGRRRGWAAITQVTLAVLLFVLAGVGDRPETPWVVLALTFAIALAAATQDIAVDAYAVDVLRKEEQGVAVGARIAMYRAGMFIAGGLAITAAASFSWPVVCVALGLLYLPMLLITIFAPEPSDVFARPQTLREAVWQPFLGFLSRHRALEILAFVLLFKLADNFGQALLRPFLVDAGYSDFDRGVALTTVGTAATIGGSLLGGALTNVIGLGTALWVFGLLQIFSNLGYVLLANIPVNVPVMYSAMGFETLTQGLGTGAFSVLLLRMTQKRFSAAQYALFSTLFGLGRIVSGPIAGVTVDAVGWSTFFLLTMPLGIPGLVMLGRFVKPGQREVEFEVREPVTGPPLTRKQLAARGMTTAAVGFAAGTLMLATMATLKLVRRDPSLGFPLDEQIVSVLAPSAPTGWIQLFALVAFAAILGVFGAAAAAASRGAGRELLADEP